MEPCYEVLITVSSSYPFVRGRLPTRYSPVRRFPLILASEELVMSFSLDLHVLSTPPAFILSQDQTLNQSFIAQNALLTFRIFIVFPSFLTLKELSVFLHYVVLKVLACIRKLL